MDSHLKHRLVGALVVISLAVIVSPLLFDFSDSGRIDRTSQVPEKPDDLPELMTIEAPTPVEDVEPIPNEDPFVPQIAMPMIDEPFSDEQLVDGEARAEEVAEQIAQEMEQRIENSAPSTGSSELSPTEVVQVDADSSVEPVLEQADENAPVLNEQGLPNAWVIQVGAFSEIDKAEAFRDQLIGEQWKAYFSRPVVGSDGLFRVFVGPFVDPKEANSVKARLDLELETNTMLLPFEP